MTQTEYENKKRECWEEYFKHVVCGTDSHEYWFNKIFDRAYTLGKQEKDAEETVISGWIARDMDGRLYIYEDKPKRNTTEWLGRLSPEFELNWSDDPIEVELIIKRKKK